MSSRNKVSAGSEGRRTPIYDSYGRLSRVPETGELEKVETQLADNRKVVERLGGVLGEELSDGLSAWKLSVRRPGWERLLERVESGASDGIVVWHTDRLFRQPKDLEHLIELANRGYRVASAHGERDLSDPDDRFILRIEVAHAARSSDDTSRRLKRKFAAMRAKGDPNTGGPRKFGFPGMETGSDGERHPVTDEQVERERTALRGAMQAVASGVGLMSIVREWNAAGLRSVPGRLPWTHKSVRKTLQRPSLAGLIEHDGVVEGHIDGEAITDEDTFRRVQTLFASRGRGAPTGVKYVGSGIARCGSCGVKLTGRRTAGQTYRDGETRRVYFCHKDRHGCGKVNADARAVDREIRTFVVARLSDPKHAAAVSAARARTSQRLAQVEQEIHDCEQLQEALSARLGSRQMTLKSFDEANEPLARDLARLMAERDSLVAPTDSDASTGTDDLGRVRNAEQVAEEWDAATISEQRAMFTQALGDDWRMIVVPATKTGKRVFDRSRVQVVPRDGFTESYPSSGRRS